MLGGSGVGLHHIGNLADSLGYLVDGTGLPFYGVIHHCHLLSGLSGQVYYLGNGRGNIGNGIGAIVYGFDGTVNQFHGSFCGCIGFGSQFPHFGCHYGKAFPGLTGSCGFYGGVQGQNIGLKGDAFDSVNDVLYFIWGDCICRGNGAEE